MHTNATLANEIRKWETHREYDVDSIDLAKARGLIAPDPKSRTTLVLTRKGRDFVQKWR